MFSFQERNKLVRRIILWSVIIGGMVAMFILQTKVHAYAQDNNYNLNSFPHKIAQAVDPKPIDPCNNTLGIGGCLLNNSDYSGLNSRDGIAKFILKVVYFLIYLSAAIAVLFGVLGGYKMIISNGSEEKYKEGLKTLTNALIGMVVAALSLTIVTFVTRILDTGFTF